MQPFSLPESSLASACLHKMYVSRTRRLHIEDCVCVMWDYCFTCTHCYTAPPGMRICTSSSALPYSIRDTYGFLFKNLSMVPYRLVVNSNRLLSFTTRNATYHHCQAPGSARHHFAFSLIIKCVFWTLLRYPKMSITDRSCVEYTNSSNGRQLSYFSSCRTSKNLLNTLASLLLTIC